MLSRRNPCVNVIGLWLSLPFCLFVFSWNDEPYNQSTPHNISERNADNDRQGLNSDK